MSITSRPAATPSPAQPPLIAGQRLDRATFHERYEALPPGARAELIDGVVYMPSPVRSRHGRASVPPIVWLSYYEENTPGVEVLDNASVALGPATEVQPDAFLQVMPTLGGQARDEEGIIFGAPELVVEVSHSTKRADLGPKLVEYELAGVQEYVIRLVEPDDVRWHARREGKLALVAPDGDGLYRSSAFPGLWLDPRALLAGDMRRLRAVVDLGVATAEHAAWVAKLAARRA